jgi:hypothetical protein
MVFASVCSRLLTQWPAFKCTATASFCIISDYDSADSELKLTPLNGRALDPSQCQVPGTFSSVEMQKRANFMRRRNTRCSWGSLESRSECAVCWRQWVSQGSSSNCNISAAVCCRSSAGRIKIFLSKAAICSFRMCACAWARAFSKNRRWTQFYHSKRWKCVCRNESFNRVKLYAVYCSRPGYGSASVR